jgi:hypothetical protein
MTEALPMRLRTALSFATLAAFLSPLSIGCGEGTDVKVATVSGDVKPSPLTSPSQLKGNARRAVGPGSSANWKSKFGQPP